ncbi:U2 small nuclear ribonucleoprotein auxiliary factor 35 kDa subunit-related protein 2 isoform X2 [Malaya genurostris]|uniref:U2 small nuclear ribonucleoprotein auxiliary factor 35 kDa subunit-related protein 2 isoform X2 n=1 Tax=Malaya genurostris TaxID=325434 RepID=UPI0026F3DA25|nr:U2 small nuclear ribonucleoprotein auxiliary factor 35 kDa subunit-related protein 2 isoform X2 [Malaya genurostris]
MENEKPGLNKKQKSMSRREWRKLFKKLRRKRIRQQTARKRDLLLEHAESLKKANPSYVEYLREKEQLEFDLEQQLEERRRYENALWVDREREFQLAFRERQKQIANEQREENEKRERIRKEFEEQNRKIRAAKLEKEQLMEELRKKQQEKERMWAEFIVGIDDHVPTLCEITHTRPGGNPCLFFGKVGACRFGIRCSSNHQVPGLSELIMMPNFFAHPALDDQQHLEYGTDASLEFDENELQRFYKDFFLDIIEEFESFGTIKGIFVCRNFEPHLRGNVFIQFNDMRSAAKAYQRMNGRFYASKQLHVEFRLPITWTSAVCGKWCYNGSSELFISNAC